MCIISNDYLVVVLVADDRSQSRDVAQSRQDDKEAETIIQYVVVVVVVIIVLLRVVLVRVSCIEREERDTEKFVCRDHTKLLLDLSLLVGFKVLSP